MEQNSCNFLELTGRLADPETARFIVLPLPYDETASYLKGTAKAPHEILLASHQLEFFDEELCDDFHTAGIYTAPAVELLEATPEQTFDRIYNAVVPYVKKRRFVLGLGGEHSVSVPLIQAANEQYENLSLLHIDAHADLREEYEGSKLSHACVMRRVHEMDVPFVSVGIRSLDKPQYEYIRKHDLQILSPRQIESNSDWITKVIDRLTDNVYITLDIDGLDPSIAPGTGTPEPGGLSYRQVVDLILQVGRSKNIVSADIVEVIPQIAGVTTEFLAARLSYKIIAAAQLKD